MVAKIHGTRPALDRGVVREAQVEVRAAEAVEHGGVVDGDCRLAGETFQEVEPAGVGLGVTFAAEADFQYAADPPLGDHRDRPVACESLGPKWLARVDAVAALTASSALCPPFQHGAAGGGLVVAEGRPSGRVAPVPSERGVLQPGVVGRAEQHGGGVDLQLAAGLAEDYVKGHRQVVGRRDGPVDLAERLGPFGLLFELRIQLEHPTLGFPTLGLVDAEDAEPW